MYQNLQIEINETAKSIFKSEKYLKRFSLTRNLSVIFAVLIILAMIALYIYYEYIIIVNYSPIMTSKELSQFLNRNYTWIYALMNIYTSLLIHCIFGIIFFGLGASKSKKSYIINTNKFTELKQQKEKSHS